MKMQFLVAGLVGAALFASTPDAAAHGGWAGHGGGWAGHGGGNWAGHGGGGWAGHGGGNWAGHRWGGWARHGGGNWGGGRFFGPGFGFYGYGYPWWWDWDYPYYPYPPYPYYPYPYYGYDAYYGNSYYGDPHYASRDPPSFTTKWIQTALARRGYYRGPIDGEIGPGTRNAIRSFQAHQGLPVTGQMDGRLIRALES